MKRNPIPVLYKTSSLHENIADGEATVCSDLARTIRSQTSTHLSPSVVLQWTTSKRTRLSYVMSGTCTRRGNGSINCYYVRGIPGEHAAIFHRRVVAHTALDAICNRCQNWACSARRSGRRGLAHTSLHLSQLVHPEVHLSQMASNPSCTVGELRLLGYMLQS